MSFRGIVKKVIPSGLFKKVEPVGHLCEAVLMQTLAGRPAKNIKVIGVTGTNGKTSTAFLIHKMMVEAGLKTGLMTTVAYGVNNDIKPQIEHMTSVSPGQLAKRLKYMRSKNVEWLVLEVTSHALAQHRIWGVPISVAVMTNITHEHLDYHGTFERYRDAKRMLFKLANKNKKGLRTGIINGEDPSAGLFSVDVKNHLSYGIKEGDIRAKHIDLKPSGSRYAATIGKDEYWIKCNLPGTFNVFNSMAAVGVGRTIGLSKDQIEKGIEALQGVEGRMTRIDEGQPFDVIVDYAHTPDSFEKLFKDIKPVVKGKLIVMFGSAGRRDEGKRATQGQLAGKYADEIVITEEDDRDIDGQEIMDAIARGAEKEGKTRDKDMFLVHDRTEAIKFTLERAKKGDTVLLLGKGHEKDILRNGPKATELRHLKQDDYNPDRVKEDPWDEIKTTKTLLKK
ncbi:MAG TPA: UDP-N-acetylmuramoyl-L-alanyl-D-glutamate--2,6-diaminopimelate ligase [Candidatus Saccharibacteria bacterium]|nr:UDP-N-acetylmuramoyl-L-alanyl-D-glutamate--2,6-diaminopimelate ligase [Candidatus Saccharibacteria bacterium]